MKDFLPGIMLLLIATAALAGSTKSEMFNPVQRPDVMSPESQNFAHQEGTVLKDDRLSRGARCRDPNDPCVDERLGTIKTASVHRPTMMAWLAKSLTSAVTRPVADTNE